MKGRRGRPPGPGRTQGRGRLAASRPDRRRLRAAAARFLEAIGERDLRRDQARTPDRVAEAWADEIVSGYAVDPRRVLGRGFPARDRDLVIIRDIPFVSICVHHLLPFIGTAHVGYLPGKRIAGLSKIARVVDALSRRLQLQERLTRQVTSVVMEGLEPLGVACRMEAEHLCMTVRGARKRGARVVTTAYEGTFRARPALRAEFLRLSGDAPRGAAAR